MCRIPSNFLAAQEKIAQAHDQGIDRDDAGSMFQRNPTAVFDDLRRPVRV